MSLPLLEQLVRLMADNALTTIELQDGGQRIVLSRGGQSPSVGMMPAMQGLSSTGMSAAVMGANQSAGAMPSSPAATSGPPTTADALTRRAAGMLEIKSPMVGTYYALPTPDAKPFVQIGDRVNPDTDVCIIEAMKVFNNIKAEVSGTIERMLVENGTAVEYGQVLFLVRPA